MVMQPRPFDPERDLPAVAELLGRTRASGGLSHPGGIQWWLRDLGLRPDFEAFIWSGGNALVGFALVDGTFVVTERAENGPTQLQQLDWLTGHLRETGRKTIEVHLAEGDPDIPVLESKGFVNAGIEYELMADLSSEPQTPDLPDGFRFASLSDVSDDAFIDGHKAAWSDKRPSPYRRELHEAVKQMPQFRSDLVTIVLAPDETVASYCIAWMDVRSATVEIEPLGTHRDYRRLGLAHAVVKEVQRRAWAIGAKRVLVWNPPESFPAAYGLYTGAEMAPNRTLIELSRKL